MYPIVIKVPPLPVQLHIFLLIRKDFGLNRLVFSDVNISIPGYISIPLNGPILPSKLRMVFIPRGKRPLKHPPKSKPFSLTFLTFFSLDILVKSVWLMLKIFKLMGVYAFILVKLILFVPLLANHRRKNTIVLQGITLRDAIDQRLLNLLNFLHWTDINKFNLPNLYFFPISL